MIGCRYIILCKRFLKSEYLAGVNKTRVGMIAFSNDTEHVFGLGEYNEHTDYDTVELVPRPVKKYGTETHKGLRLMRQKFKSEGRSEQVRTQWRSNISSHD